MARPGCRRAGGMRLVMTLMRRHRAGRRVSRTLYADGHGRALDGRARMPVAADGARGRMMAGQHDAASRCAALPPPLSAQEPAMPALTRHAPPPCRDDAAFNAPTFDITRPSISYGGERVADITPCARDGRFTRHADDALPARTVADHHITSPRADGRRDEWYIHARGPRHRAGRLAATPRQAQVAGVRALDAGRARRRRSSVAARPSM